jgi:LmbE family N-acetylglucosaminyl deacetylase
MWQSGCITWESSGGRAAAQDEEERLVITSAAGVAELGTILGVWAHPDDEAYLSGGLMTIARQAGGRVVCVTATRGELGTGDPETWPPDRLRTERTAEMARCMEILGVEEHHWLDYPDGGCAEVPAHQAVGRLCAIVDEVRPDTLLTFGPDGITGHLDHQTVGSWTAAAFRRAAPRDARLLQAAATARRAANWAQLSEELGVFEPGYPIVVSDDRLAVDLVLPPDVVARKVEALAAQATQTAGLLDLLGRDTYAAWVSDESFAEA